MPPLIPPRGRTELSNRLRYRAAGVAGALLVRLWGRTLRVEWEFPASVGALERAGMRVIYAIWHAHILTFSHTHRGRGIVVLVSRHGDGEFISQIAHHLGFGTIRGSTSRGGLRALLEMVRHGRRGHPLGVTPDGPRGPRHVVQPGILLISQRTGMPIVPMAAGARRVSLLKNWDRFELPHFFSRVLVVGGEPLYPPPEASPESLVEIWGPLVQEAMERVETRAKAWSCGGGEG